MLLIISNIKINHFDIISYFCKNYQKIKKINSTIAILRSYF